MPLYRDSIKHTVIPMLTRCVTELDVSRRSSPEHLTNFSDAIEKLKAAIGAIDACSDALKTPERPIPPLDAPGARGRVSDNWMPMVTRVLINLNAEGPDAIQSTWEAVIKTTALSNIFFADPSVRQQIFFRGEVDYSWNLIPLAARKGLRHNLENPLTVSAPELEALETFREAAKTDLRLRSDICGERASLPVDDDPAWWGIAQHYDQHVGTRMLDLTSSIYAALFFACVDWNGAIDASVDGALYFLPINPGRRETESPQSEKEFPALGDSIASSVASYFDLSNSPETPRLRTSRGRNDRLIAQDGYFLWHAAFEKPIEPHTCIKWRVVRNKKKEILRELFSVGYTPKRIIGGARGEEVERKLISNLGLTQEEYVRYGMTTTPG